MNARASCDTSCMSLSLQNGNTVENRSCHGQLFSLTNCHIANKQRNTIAMVTTTTSYYNHAPYFPCVHPNPISLSICVLWCCFQFLPLPHPHTYMVLAATSALLLYREIRVRPPVLCDGMQCYRIHPLHYARRVSSVTDSLFCPHVLWLAATAIPAAAA